MVNAYMQDSNAADKEHWIVDRWTLSPVSLKKLGRNFKAIKLIHPIYAMQQFATKVRDKARLHHLRKRREMTSNLGSNSSNLDQKAPGNDSSEARDVVEEATGGFGGNQESDE